MGDIRQREGYDEIRQKLLNAFTAEERLAGLGAEERLAGLSREEMLLALPVELLRALDEDFIKAQPARVRRAIRQRLAQAE
ncbi:hypothetical protein [Haliangium sp.]|uniref:hypothetical protein n=1 Tax=Haliangium sp. TaxID=2663208 RepID=UPI003D14BB5A